MTKFDILAQAISEETNIGLDTVRRVLAVAQQRKLLVPLEHSQVQLPAFPSVLTGDRMND